MAKGATMDTDTDTVAGLGENIPPAEQIKVAKPKSRAATVKILLEENDDIPPTGLFLGLNGMSYLLRPGVAVDVPVGLKDILDHSIISVPEVDPQTRQTIGWRDRMKYPYRMV